MTYQGSQWVEGSFALGQTSLATRRRKEKHNQPVLIKLHQNNWVFKVYLTLLFDGVHFLCELSLNCTHRTNLTSSETDCTALYYQYTLAVTQKENLYRTSLETPVISALFQMPHVIICFFLITNGDIYADSYCFTRPLLLIALDSELSDDVWCCESVCLSV